MPLHDMPLRDMQAIERRITKDVFEVLSAEKSVKSRVSYGGTAPRTCAGKRRAGSSRWRGSGVDRRQRGVATVPSRLAFKAPASKCRRTLRHRSSRRWPRSNPVAIRRRQTVRNRQLRRLQRHQLDLRRPARQPSRHRRHRLLPATHNWPPLPTPFLDRRMMSTPCYQRRFARHTAGHCHCFQGNFVISCSDRRPAVVRLH